MSIEKVAVIGSGIMGHGITQVAAMSRQVRDFYKVDPLLVDWKSWTALKKGRQECRHWME